MKNTQNNVSFLKINTFLISLLPIALLTGPAMSDFIVIITSLFFLFYIIFYKISIIFKKKIFILFLFFYFFLILTSFLSSDMWLSLRFSLPYIRFIFLAFLVCYLIKNNKTNFYKYFFISSIFVFFILYIDSFYQFFTGKNTFGFPIIVEGRVSSFFKDELILGSYVLKMAPMLLTTIFYLKISILKKKIMFFFILTISFLMILISGDRAPLLLFFLFFLLLFFFFRKYRNYFYLFLIFYFFILIISMSLNKNMHDRFIKRTVNELGLGDSKYNSEQVRVDEELKFYQKKVFFFSAIHHNYYLTGLKIFKDNYFIGAGPKLYPKLAAQEKYAIDKFSVAPHPHNFYIQLLAETGLIGFSLVFFFFIFLFKFYFKLYKKNYKNFSILVVGIPLSGLIFHLWPFITTGSFFTNYNCILVYLCVGFFLGEKKNQ